LLVQADESLHLTP